MNQSSNTGRNLEERVRALELELARLSERLRTVGAALGGVESLVTHSPSSEARKSGPRLIVQRGGQVETASSAAPGPTAKKTARGAQAGGPRKWFEKGEALALFRKILKRPMLTRDLMARVVAAKGTAQLPKKDLERFKWAVHAALKEAVGANAIVRQDRGMVAVASGNLQVAGKRPRKTKE